MESLFAGLSTPVTKYHVWAFATVVLRAVVLLPATHPLPAAPTQKQKWLSDCFSSRQPSELAPPVFDIFSTMLMSHPVGLKHGSLAPFGPTSALNHTHSVTVNPRHSCAGSADCRCARLLLCH